MSQGKRPPTPSGIPLIGNGLAFSRDPIDAMETWAAVDDVVRLTFPGRELYMVSHPDIVRRILVEDQDRFTIGPAQREFFSGVEDHAVTTNTGDRWRRLRRALHPAFTRARIREYAPATAATVARRVDAWTDGERFDLLAEMRCLTVQVLGEALLGRDLRGSEDVVMDAADALIDRANFRRPGQLLPDWVPTPTDRRFRRRVRDLDAFVADVLADGEPDASHTVRADLMAAHDRGDLSMPEVRHNLVALLLAGHDSPATALASTWYLLSEHPDERERLVAEVDEVLGGNSADADDVDALERTRNVINEVLRLYPPTTGVNRQATEAIELGGYAFEAGDQFMLPQWVLHRDARFWDDPERFDPDRWAGETDSPEYACFPFSGGPRACIGSDFARQELVIALATTLQRGWLAVEADGPLTFAPSIQLRPETDLTATAHRR